MIQYLQIKLCTGIYGLIHGDYIEDSSESLHRVVMLVVSWFLIPNVPGKNEFPYVSLDVHSWQNLCWPLVLLLNVRYWFRSMTIKLFCILESMHSLLVFLRPCRLSHSNILPCLLCSLVSGRYNRYIHRVARLCTCSSDLVSQIVLAYSTLGLTM